MDFTFLKSNRFWALVIGAVVTYLYAKGWIGMPEMILVDTIMGGHILVRTVDRTAEVIAGR